MSLLMNHALMAMQVLLDFNTKVIALLILLEEEENELLASKPKRSRTWTPRLKWEMSPWNIRYLQGNNDFVNNAANAREFRNCFRMPWQAFCLLVDLAKEEMTDYDESSTNCLGYQAAPLNLMILAYLAVLGATVTYPHLYTLTHLGAQTHRKFFAKFSKFGREKLYPRFVTVPSTAAEFQEVMRDFTKAGFPGCVGAVDCTHVRLWNCSTSQTNRHRGKEGYPSRAFQVVCDANRRVIHTTVGYQGSASDKTICDRDAFVNGVRRNTIGGDVQWEILNEQGVREARTGGLYFIVDGGYNNWQCLVTNVPSNTTEEIKVWSNMLESLRKSIECCFGIVKVCSCPLAILTPPQQRFRILKKGVDFPSFYLLDDVWFTALALHNMLLEKSDGDVQVTGTREEEDDEEVGF